ncbi:ribosome assembly RNA-binding protein YhbY [Nitrosovibrio sp. Nv4]|uniref:ribosome assembly RNA-binding protein YhbY n=1 Tax=Nitrosovibrio sp. Nv4 TaxID=1945880 RepID=UPI000BC67740|nr:ribosome assembly RNA-binding protein YhbY [Nitrosovibrio sp. Nv4]SOD40678.1 putative RNA-binding protein, YhbY family [Nitrosovibrio sp. Nv4]
MLELALARRRDLRSRAHGKKPIVWIGAAGLSEGIMRELDVGLKSHELIKVKVSSDERETRNALLEEICRRLEAVAVQHIGKILVIYRPRSAETIETTKPDITPLGNEKKLRQTKRGLSA